ncbi:MAG: hypothetical protein ABSD85_08025 [Acidimicrobiales bacterium]|jgi:TolA-binding protein
MKKTVLAILTGALVIAGSVATAAAFTLPQANEVNASIQMPAAHHPVNRDFAGVTDNRQRTVATMRDCRR